MTDTLGQMVYEVARALRITTSGKATGGSTVTLVDASATALKEFAGKDDDFWNGGTIGIRKTADGAAPQGQFSEISDYDKTTTTITLQDALTAPIENDDRYWVAKKSAPLHKLIEAINDVLEDMHVETTDTTTITTAANQTEYSLPAVAAMDLREVWIQRQSDANDNAWERVVDWSIQKTATGTADLLVFAQQPETGMSIKLVYVAGHAELWDYDDQLDENIKRKYVTLTAATLILREWLIADPRVELQSHWNILQDELKLLGDGWKKKKGPPVQVKLNTRFSNRRRRWIGDDDRFK